MKWLAEDELSREISLELARLGKKAVWLEKETGLSRANIQNLLSGRSQNPRASTLQPVARALGWGWDPETLRIGKPDGAADALDLSPEVRTHLAQAARKSGHEPSAFMNKLIELGLRNAGLVGNASTALDKARLAAEKETRRGK